VKVSQVAATALRRHTSAPYEAYRIEIKQENEGMLEGLRASPRILRVRHPFLVVALSATDLPKAARRIERSGAEVLLKRRKSEALRTQGFGSCKECRSDTPTLPIWQYIKIVQPILIKEHVAHRLSAGSTDTKAFKGVPHSNPEPDKDFFLSTDYWHIRHFSPTGRDVDGRKSRRVRDLGLCDLKFSGHVLTLSPAKGI
jgi:hypothetical protein